MKTMTANEARRVTWICHDCAVKYAQVIEGHCATFHEDPCGVCGETKWVTEPRDFRWPRVTLQSGDTNDLGLDRNCRDSTAGLQAGEVA